MPAEIFLLKKFNHTAENIAFNDLARDLQNSPEHFLLIGNVEIEGFELDAIVFKNNAIIIIDFKDTGGEIIFSENEEWKKIDGTIIKAGSHKNPLMQIKTYKRKLGNYLENNNEVLNNCAIEMGHINGLLLFSEHVNIDLQNFPGSIRPWFKVCSKSTSLNILEEIVSNKTNIDLEEIKTLFKTNDYPVFNLTDYNDNQIALVTNLETVSDEEKNILNYYISCLEISNLKELTIKKDDKSTYINYKFQEQIDLDLPNNNLLKIFLIKELKKPNKKNLFYGIQVKSYTENYQRNGQNVQDEYLYPTFYAPVEIQFQDNNPKYLIYNLKYELNSVFLTKSHYQFEDNTDRNQIREEIDRIENLQEKNNRLNQLNIINNDQNYNSDIFFFSNNTSATKDLIAELNSLKTYKFNELINSNSILLINKDIINNPNNNNSNIPFLEVSPLNELQELSIVNSINNKLTVVTGPPGTGKSQVILNLIANAIYENKSVLFSSNNNYAVDVVKNRIHELFVNDEIFKFLFLRTGNKTIINEELLRHLDSLTTNIDQFNFNFQQSEILNNEISDINNSLVNYKKIIKDSYEFKNKLNEIKNSNDDLLINILLNCHHCNIDESLLNVTIDELNGFIEKKNINIIEKIILKLFPRYYPKKYFKFYNEQTEKLEQELKEWVKENYIFNNLNFDELRKNFINLKNLKLNFRILKEASNFIRKNIEIDRNILDTGNMEKYLDTIIEDSKSEIENKKVTKREISFYLLKQKLSELVINSPNLINLINRYKNYINSFVNYVNNGINWKNEQTYIEFNKLYKDLLNILKIWMSTNLSISKSVPSEEHEIFDLLVIDEASQCDIPSSIPLFYRAKQIVVIGDDLQLQHISGLTDLEDVSIAKKFKLSQNFYGKYSNESLFKHCLKIINNSNQKEIFLEEHYRSNSHIMEFSNKYFYIPKKGKKMINRFSGDTDFEYNGIYWKDVVCNNNEDEINRNLQKMNDREVNEIINLYRNLENSFNQNNFTVGITTPFRNQANLIYRRLLNENINQLNEINILGNTIHKFQGDERDIMFFHL